MRVLVSEDSRKMARDPAAVSLSSFVDEEADSRAQEWREACQLGARLSAEVVGALLSMGLRTRRRRLWKV